MIEYANHPSFMWIAIGVVCLIGEVVLPSFGLVFAGGAAFLTAAVAAIYPGWEVQTAIFAVSVLGSLYFLRPLALKRFHKNSGQMLSRTEALIGQTGRVTERLIPTGETGRVVVNGQDWAARVADSSDIETVEIGAAVIVVGADGIVLHVKLKETV